VPGGRAVAGASVVAGGRLGADRRTLAAAPPPLAPKRGGVLAWWVGGMLAAGVIGLVLGGLTDAGQTWLPWAASSMANSGGSWVVVTFFVALTGAGGVGQAAVRGATSMVGLVVGYYVTADQRGIPVAGSAVRFWVVAALLIGPLVGVAAAWARHGSPDRVAVGAGVVGGLLIGESVYGLRYISHSTSSTYWWLQAAGGLVLVLGLLAWRARRRSAAPVAVLTAVVVGVATLGAYVQ
jgi:hypothetical protein